MAAKKKAAKKKDRAAAEKKTIAARERKLLKLDDRVLDLADIERIRLRPELRDWIRTKVVKGSDLDDCNEDEVCKWIKSMAPAAGGAYDGKANLLPIDLKGVNDAPYLVYLQATVNALVLAVKSLELNACGKTGNGPYFINPDCTTLDGGGGEGGGAPPPPRYPPG